MVTRNIIFDFGGVFIDIDYMKTEQAFVDAGITHFRNLYSQHKASALFEDLETGKISPAQFCAHLRSVSGVALTDEQIIRCWNSMIGDYFPEAIEKVKALTEHYRVFLYSNTNEIHYEKIREIYRNTFGRDDFNTLFEKAWYSHEVGYRKPYTASYEWVLKDASLRADETMFVDDTLVNVEGAIAAGLQGMYLQLPARMWEMDAWR